MAIISGCDASPVFQLAEHALDDIAAPIDRLIEGYGVRRVAVDGMTALIFRRLSQ